MGFLQQESVSQTLLLRLQLDTWSDCHMLFKTWQPKYRARERLTLKGVQLAELTCEDSNAAPGAFRQKVDAK